MGPRARKVYEALDTKRPIAIKDIALAAGVGGDRVRHLLATMAKHGMVSKDKTGGWVRLTPDLDAIAETLGVAGAGERQRAKHKKDRKAFRKAMGYQEEEATTAKATRAADEATR